MDNDSDEGLHEVALRLILGRWEFSCIEGRESGFIKDLSLIRARRSGEARLQGASLAYLGSKGLF